MKNAEEIRNKAIISRKKYRARMEKQYNSKHNIFEYVIIYIYIYIYIYV
jgi:hypothetical protein